MPGTTRKRISRALNMLRNKQVENPWKKHDNIPLLMGLAEAAFCLKRFCAEWPKRRQRRFFSTPSIESSFSVGLPPLGFDLSTLGLRISLFDFFWPLVTVASSGEVKQGSKRRVGIASLNLPHAPLVIPIQTHSNPYTFLHKQEERA
jgi:hypothetical protein